MKLIKELYSTWELGLMTNPAEHKTNALAAIAVIGFGLLLIAVGTSSPINLTGLPVPEAWVPWVEIGVKVWCTIMGLALMLHIPSWWAVICSPIDLAALILRMFRRLVAEIKKRADEGTK